MSKTQVIFFATTGGSVPVLEWLDGLPETVRIRFIGRIERLTELGSQLRRPEADHLRDGIFELRVRHRRTNYRLLYFFDGGRAVLCHGLTKEREVPDLDIREGDAAQGRVRFGCSRPCAWRRVRWIRMRGQQTKMTDAVEASTAATLATTRSGRPRSNRRGSTPRWRGPFTSFVPRRV